MDFALARENMVKSQILPNRVTEPELLDVFFSTSREDFVDSKHREVAYSDFPVSMGGRRCLTPLQIALLIQALEVKPGCRVLVVGAGTGYEALLLAKLGATVYALESEELLAAKGRHLTTGLDIHWKTGLLAQGWQSEAPFDKILFCGAITEVSEDYLRQLAGSGHLVAIIGRDGDVVMDMIRIDGPGGVGRPRTLFQTVAVTLSELASPRPFEL